jgi:hypothetical protein
MRIRELAAEALRRVADTIEPSRQPAPTATTASAGSERLGFGLIDLGDRRRAGVHDFDGVDNIARVRPSDRLSAPVVSDIRSSRGVPDRPAGVGQQPVLPTPRAGDLPYGSSPSNRGNGPDWGIK